MQVLLVSQTGVVVGQAPFTPVDELFLAGAQVTHTLLTQAGAPLLHLGLGPSLPFCASRQVEHLCVEVSQAGVVPRQAEALLQPVLKPPGRGGLGGSLASARG